MGRQHDVPGFEHGAVGRIVERGLIDGSIVESEVKANGVSSRLGDCRDSS